jgi:ParB-like chromosome segregation protein Spo0J
VNELQNIKKEIMDQFIQLDIDEKINFSNEIKELLHALGPFSSEPVDCVVWVKNDKVTANDYNPNSVAPPEMKLLEHSISEDGYTQPIVTYPRPEDEKIEVVDGFHRHRVGKESPLIQSRVHGYLPVVKIRSTQSDKNDRMASTIRHNRARGKHKIESMSDMVIELTRRNWSDEKIAKNLGMDSDEVLRLKQITGLAEMFSDKDFSRAWDIETSDEAGEDIEKDLD